MALGSYARPKPFGAPPLNANGSFESSLKASIELSYLQLSVRKHPDGFSCFDERLGKFLCRPRCAAETHSVSEGRSRSDISPAEGAAKRCASRGA